jgi:hypothetical protein
LKVLLAFFDSPDKDGTFDRLYRQLLVEKDREGAGAAAFAAALSILNSGRRLDRLEVWHDRILTFERSASRTSSFLPTLMGAKGIIELILKGNPRRAAASFLKGSAMAQQHSMHSQHQLLTLGACIAFCYQSDSNKIGSLLFDLWPLADHWSTPNVIKGCIRLAKGMHLHLLGDAQESVTTLFQILNTPQWNSVPAFIVLFAYYQLLAVAVETDDDEAIRQASRHLQKAAILSRNEFFHGLTHFALGKQALRKGKPETTLLHAKFCKEKANLCGSAFLDLHSDYLTGRALHDLHRVEDAIGVFNTMKDKTRKLGIKRFEIGGSAGNGKNLMRSERPGIPPGPLNS